MYRVEVLHYLNPHLIWVEVLDPSDATDQKMFELVGLYGLLPLERTLDIELNWIPAVTKILKDIFKDSTEVWFSLSYIDRSTSIFDDNIHKYGELLIKHKGSELIKLSKFLIKKNLAYFDVKDFHQKLSFGNLNTKLSYIKTKEVVREIEKCYPKNNPKLKSEKQNTFIKQTSVFQSFQEFESSLTVNYVGGHNNEMLSEILEQKAWDFELCKEIDEESVGCGSRRKSYNEENAFKQRQAAHCSQSSNNYERIFDDIRNFLATNSKVKCNTENEVSEQDCNQSASNAFINKKTLNQSKQRSKSELDKKEDIQNASNTSTNIEETLKTEDEATCSSTNKTLPSGYKDIKVSSDKKISQTSDEENADDVSDNSSLKEDETSQKSSNVCKPSNSTNTKQVAFGPPELDSRSNSTTDNEEEKPEEIPTEEVLVKYNVNPFKNMETDVPAFVDNLVSPVLMVHYKINRHVQPIQNLRDVCFNEHIHEVLKYMSIKSPMIIQTMSWPVILRGFSLFMISPPNTGKTMGYLPAVCRLVSGSIIDGSGPIAIIVCATANLVENVEKNAKMFLGLEHRIFAYYPGVDDSHVETFVNSCDLLIATPCYLSKLFQMPHFTVDLRRLSIFVMDDCERLFSIYEDEIETFQIKIEETLSRRKEKESKVQYILASPVWCNNMDSLALKVPRTVICIGAFQECVRYSKADVSVCFTKNNTFNCLIDFLQKIDRSKKTVIVIDDDINIYFVKCWVKINNNRKQMIYTAHKNMTVQDLQNLSDSWSQCPKGPNELGPILICCDQSLAHMGITDAHNLVHFSLPRLYSMFCKRFSVLNDNYPSIFKDNNDVVKIKIFVNKSNGEQLPKIINFIKKFTAVPYVLDGVCKNILKENDVIRAKNLVPLCDSFLMLGECPEFFYCNLRHTIIKDYDMPLKWLPTEGLIIFKLLKYNSPTSYFGRLVYSYSSGKFVKYQRNYSELICKMRMHYDQGVNRKLLGYPKVGDICAVRTEVFIYKRCQVVKILSEYETGNPNEVLIKLIDYELYGVTRDINLYHLPEVFKAIETYVAPIKLINIKPKYNDTTFSDLAKNHIQNIVYNENERVYLKGHIALTIGNCIFVDTLEVCVKNSDEVIHNIRYELLMKHHAVLKNFLPGLKKKCIASGLPVRREIECDRHII
ncbi:unnamed protein product, partial [Brenthis ino]